MRGFGLLIGLWMGLMLQGANAGAYTLADGTSISGDPINYNDAGVLLKTGEDSYLPRIPWGKFTDEALRQLLNEAKKAKNTHDQAILEPMVPDEPASEKAKFRQIAVKPVEMPVRPGGPLGVLAILGSPLGWLLLLVLYGGNLFAACEIAIYRNRPLPTVCGLAAIPLIGVATSLYFLSLPEQAPAEDLSSPSGAAAAPGSNAPVPMPPASTPAGREMAAAPAEEEPEPALFMSSQPKLPEPLVFRRGDFLFNRRFFETKLTGFFRVVLSAADKDMLIHIKSDRGDFVGKRISRITPSELYLEVFKEDATAEEMIPFVEILEVQIRHKDLP